MYNNNTNNNNLIIEFIVVILFALDCEFWNYNISCLCYVAVYASRVCVKGYFFKNDNFRNEYNVTWCI